ncbi:response regulator transcription factor [Thalassotalea sp. HSM 43]|uniref:response regulator transcription factor n=1 Tax=Thalassotalea sp. HSM 43 TaxID=2552945 RepID=UPI001080F726|nr:response regulator transcription factor [Thalassotalea sp. HSM 43]QBY02927.1 response regulator transcription factor [Thalassotalea sp. HSM 43]
MKLGAETIELNGAEKIKLLIIEDDIKLAQHMKGFFIAHNFKVDVYHHPDEFFKNAYPINADIIVCDINLPGGSGFKLCHEIRKTYFGPFIFLTARSEENDQIKGLELGADYYELKPIRPKLLLTKINALLRSRHRHYRDMAENKRITLDGLAIDYDRRSIKICEQSLDFTTEEFDLLWLMINKQDQVLTREFLFEKAVGRPYDGVDRIIDGRVSRIRKKFNPVEGNPYEIKTVWRKGYLFAKKDAVN